MGASISCPFAEFSDVETGLESIIVKPISFEDEEVKTPVRLVSFNSRDLEPTILTSLGSGKVEVEGSVSFKESELEELIKVNDTESPKNLDVSLEMPKKLPILDSRNPKHEAAIKLQKVYKSFRTRRKLADCAVLVEQSWWKLLDFAELKRSSISFFDIEKHETAISRWSRAGTRAAKVGKGLLKNDKAQKLALQHWLEAIDPRHRYGHNLNFYYNEWLHSKSREPFFYWLDIGKGKEVNLEKCSRSKLQQQCIKYLGPLERKAYEVVVKNGKFLYTQTGEHLNTFDDEDAKWIFVLSTTKRLYVGKKKKGTFQHSSFLAGGATTAAGRLTVDKGRLKDVCPHSGHYRPTQENFMDFISFLNKNNVDLRDVKMSPVDEEERGVEKEKSSKHIKSNLSVEGLTRRTNVLETDETNVEYSSNNVKADPVKVERDALPENPKSSKIHNLSRKLRTLEIPMRNDFVETLKSENLPLVKYDHVEDYDSADEEEEEVSDGEEDYSDDADTKPKPLDEDNEDENEVEAVPKEAILQRINSHKGSKSFQLGKQLSCKWSTGAGPRICCLRDYPLELQFRALEKVNLSPRSALGHSRSHSCFSNNSECFSSIVSMPTSSSPLPSGRSSLRDSFFGLVKKNLDQHSRAQSSPLGRRDSQNGLELNTKK